MRCGPLTRRRPARHGARLAFRYSFVLGLIVVDGVGCGGAAPPAMTNPEPGVVGGSADYVYGGQCPSSPPADGATCVPAPEGYDVVCEYGDDPRGELCHTLATCAHDIWSVVAISLSCRPPHDPGTCPASADDARNQPCAVSGSFCVYGDVPCECTSCPGGGGLDLRSCPGTPTWRCATPDPSNDPNCPPAARNFGTTCDVESIVCDFGCQSGKLPNLHARDLDAVVRRCRVLVSCLRNPPAFGRDCGPLASLLVAYIRPVCALLAPRDRAAFTPSVPRRISETGH